MQLGFIDPQDPRWAGFLAGTQYDFYHLPDYVAFAARYEGGRPVAFLAEEGSHACLIPLLWRDMPSELGADGRWFDAISPYGYPAPLIRGDAQDIVLATRFLELFRSEGRAAGLVSVFLRLHPLFPLSIEALTSCGRLVRHGQTVSIALDLTEGEAKTQMCRNHRQNIRRLKRCGFTVVIDAWQYYPVFMQLYNETMARAGADAFYFFSSDYFRTLRETLGDRLHLLCVLSPEGEVAAAGIFTIVCDISQAHLVGSAEAFLRLAPMKLLFDEARRWAAECGCRVLHLGGGVGCRQDSLFDFKAGFSDQRHSFYTYRMVLDDAQYQELVTGWARQAGGEIDQAFFPGYRAPVLAPSI